jgi:indolepyruvate ferredoxin oxidoreductase
MRGLRGKRLDPFGRAEVRRVERVLIDEYQALVDEALALLTPETHATALELLELPDVIRGYEEIKLRNVMLFRKRADAMLKRLRAGGARPPGSGSGAAGRPRACT